MPGPLDSWFWSQAQGQREEFMDRETTIAIVGAGALGIMYGQKLTAAYGKERVFFAADSQRTVRYRREGFSCNGEFCEFRYCDGTEYEKVDLVIFAVKFTGLKEALKEAGGLIGEDTAVISVLNGITSEEIIGDEWGKEHVLYCVAQGMDAVKEGNCLTYQNPGVLLLGIGEEERKTPGKNGTQKQEKLKLAADILGGAKIACEIVEDIRHRMWSKLMMNTGVNQVCAVFDVPYGGIQREGEAREQMILAMKEVQKVAAREGVSLTEEEITDWLKLVDSLNPEGMPSMRQDTLAGRRTEVELFSGTIKNLGKRHQIPTPVNDVLYEKICGQENRN